MDGYGHIWTEERVESEILKCMGILKINRMPTSTEIKQLGRMDLHNKISKTKKYSGWAEKLNLERNPSDTMTGQFFEDVVAEKLIGFGHTVCHMTTKYPYDILINNHVKADVKSGRAYMLRGSRVHSFGIHKINPTCDIYIVLALSENDDIERTFVIPSHLLKVEMLCIGAESKYNKFIERWDYIDMYTDFFKKVI